MLVVTPQEHVGKLVLFSPAYGWGWRRADNEQVTVDFKPIHEAGRCHVRIQRFFTWRGEIRGFVGGVEQPHHLFDGLHIVCGAMHKGEFDFVNNLCLRYDVEIGPAEPNRADDWPRIVSGEPNYAGYGIVAASEAVFAAHRQM